MNANIPTLKINFYIGLSEDKFYNALDIGDSYLKVIDYFTKQFEGFTVYQTKGYYKGDVETSLVLEYITDCDSITDYEIKHHCQAIKQLLNQESVLYTIQQVDICQFV